MGKPFVSLRLTTLLMSFTLTASYSFTPFCSLKLSSPSPKATPSDLLSLLGPKSKSSSIDPLLAHQLTSCFKFLVPFTPNSPEKLSGRKILRLKQKGRREEEENGLVWWPPQSVLDLARVAVDSGGDPAAIQRALDPTMITVSF